ncbi:MAG: response regulator [Deltaproteobacteria bacterium]|nr:response regulator [Deltaproteobacteria bacterium]
MAKRILLVDDDELILLSLQDLFAAAGLSVTTVGSGAEALRVAGAEPYDIVVLDVVMPGMSGLEVCRKLREIPAYARVPILLLTAKSEEADRRRGLEAGADSFLAKPFDPGRLVELVKESLPSA